MALGAPDASDSFTISDGTSGSGNSWTPPSDARCIVCVGTDTTVSSISGNGLTWTNISGASVTQGAANRIEFWEASGASPSSGAITVNLSATGDAAIQHMYWTNGGSVEDSTTYTSANDSNPSITLGTGTAGAVGVAALQHRLRTASMPGGGDETAILLNVTVGSGGDLDSCSTCYQAYGSTSGGTLDIDLSAGVNVAMGAVRIAEDAGGDPVQYMTTNKGYW